MSAEDRRDFIIASALPLFAREGFRGVTTKMLAKEAGVSEALLYQHFPSKEAIYAEVQDVVCKPNDGLARIVADLAPSTVTLMHLIVLIGKFVLESASLLDDEQRLFPRLMISSLLEDGAFARMHMERRVSQALTPLSQSFEAARQTGDLAADGTPDALRFWLVQHTLVSFHLYGLTSEPLSDYKVANEDLQEHVTWRPRPRSLPRQKTWR